MAFTFENFKAALNQGAGTVAGATAAVAINNADRVSKAIDTTTSVASKTVGAVAGVLPASNKKVDTIAAKFNKRLNDVEMKQRVQEVWIQQIAQAKGVVLAEEEEVIAELLEQDEADKTQAVVEAFTSPELLDMLGMMSEKLFGVNPFAKKADDEDEDDDNSFELIDEPMEIVEEEVKPKAKPKVKKEKQKKEETVVRAEGLTESFGKRRKKLGRQAPLAD